MYYVHDQGLTDPRLNLAVEEHLLRNLDIAEPVLFFYVNEPSVIVGRNQNVLEEIGTHFVQNQGIHVVRRLSGGGAVYHDLGNLNFSFITQGKQDLHKFAKIVDPIIRVLRDLGVEAEFRGKSDIFAAGKKISGNAQYSTAGRMFSHGTLLFDSDLDSLSKALTPRKVAIKSKAVQSIRNQVINIRDLLLEDMTIDDLRRALLRGLFGPGPIPTYSLTPPDWEQIRQISAERYQQWDWNYGRSPKYSINRSEHFPSGKIDVYVEVEGGRIQAIKFSGKLAGPEDIIELEKALIGVRYDPKALAQALEPVDLHTYFGQLDGARLVDLLFG